MNIEFLDLMISASMTLRKVKRIILKEKGREHKMRPQIHPMVIIPFGGGKSTIIKKLNEAYDKDVFIIDNFTKPSIEGSISKDGTYVPSILTKCGGKILAVDEWNNCDEAGKNSLLSLLENQFSRRTLGFRVKLPFRYKDKYTNFNIIDNIISCECFFTCMVFAMEYPYLDEQKSKALISRFSPLFIDMNKDLIIAITSGNFDVNVNSIENNVEYIIISEELLCMYHKLFFEYIENQMLVNIRDEDMGFLGRVYSELIRYGIYNYLKNNIEITKKRLIEIDVESINYFNEQFIYINVLLNNMVNRGCLVSDKLVLFKRLYDMYGKEKTNIYYANMLGVGDSMISKYKNKLNM